MRAESALPPARSKELERQLEGLQWLQIAFVHEVQGDLSWHGFAGSLWHGVLGAALHDIDAGAYAALYGAQDDDTRLWSLVPPLVEDEWVPAGACMTSQLRLVGPLMPLAGACVAAFAAFGHRGLGSERVPARLVDVQLHGPWGPCTLSDTPAAVWCGLDVWDDAQHGATDTALELRCHTPLRFKHRGEVCTEVPAFEDLLRRAIARVARLLSAQGLEQRFMAEGEKAGWLDWAGLVPLLHSEAVPVRVPRYSARQRREMVFEGLGGRWLYGAPATRALPWLRLAQCLQLGAKTTFGFGVIECVAVQEPV